MISPAIRLDPGFQLSVMATLALAVVVPWLETFGRWQTLVWIPVVAEAGVTPLLWHHFGAYSLVAPLVALTMAGAVMVVAASFIHPLLATVVGLLAWVPSRLIVAIAEWAAAIPWGSESTLALGTTGVVVAYAVLLGLYGLTLLRLGTPRSTPVDTPAPSDRI
jgi:hypothetical protein